MLAATLSPDLRDLLGLRGFENVPVRDGSEEYLDSEKYEIKERELDGPLLPLVAAPERGPAREPGAPALSQPDVPRDRERGPHRIREAAPGDNMVVVVRQPRPVRVRGRRRRASRRALGLAAGVPRATICSTATTSYRRGSTGRATTSGSMTRASRPRLRVRRVTLDRPSSARPGRQWFETDPLWFKRAVFYEIHIARVLRRERRRLGRPPRPDRQARLPPVARRRLHLAAADLPSRRCATAATTSPTSTRCTPTTGPSRTSAASSRPRTGAASASSPTWS